VKVGRKRRLNGTQVFEQRVMSIDVVQERKITSIQKLQRKQRHIYELLTQYSIKYQRKSSLPQSSKRATSESTPKQHM